MKPLDFLNDSALRLPQRLVEPASWVGHIPFAFWLVEQSAPQLLVELGTHSGNSYFSFCQAVQANALDTICYAVDTWEGDSQAGHYDDDIYQEVSRHNEQHYAQFSNLLRMTFDEALGAFSDDSVDLLHIDGLHTYQAVKHDFETWHPKLSERAIVLFHDINVRTTGFGVWQLWEELSVHYPHLSFSHSHGLGVLFVGKTQPETLLELLDSWSIPAQQAMIRNFFERLGSNLKLQLSKNALLDEVNSLKQQLVEREDQVSGLYQDLGNQHQQTEKMHHKVNQRDQQIELLTAELDLIFRSRSWRMTQPLRNLRPGIESCIRWGWRKTPISQRYRQRLKSVIYARLPTFLQWTQSYQIWARGQGQQDSSSVAACDVWQYDENTPPSPDNCYVPALERQPPDKVLVRAIAFYLPQFHCIPENDLWWGEGFTEWSNVRPAQPCFDGHYQPHIPADLGYYDLLDSEVQERQVELAKLYGLEGFCFYFYWFAGKRLLEKPLENYLQNAQLDLPFCLCWANENWSRRWDGLDQELLIVQQHSPADDIAFIKHVAKYMRDDRYIRVNGRPLLLVYWPGQLPSAKATAKRWRVWCRDNGLGEIYLAYTQSFEAVHPAKYGFDAAIEFPPNNMAAPDITRHVKGLISDYRGTVYDWRYFIKYSRHYKQPCYPLFRSCCPSWDNTARRKNGSTIFLHSTPQGYQEWLGNAVKDTCKQFADPDERLVFINAWNEWAEGAHLEPDQRYGYAWLEATRNALAVAEGSPLKKKLLVVSHDAHPHGAQFLALGIVRALIQDFGFEVEVILLGAGRLKSEFSALAPVHDLSNHHSNVSATRQLIDALGQRGFCRALVNTTVSGWLVPVLTQAGIDSVCLIHELPGVIRQHGLESSAQKIAELAKAVVFPAQIVADGFAEFASVDAARRTIRPQGLYRSNRWRYSKAEAKAELCQKLHLPPQAKIVLAVGYADHRKGVDLFVEVALKILDQGEDVEFIWVGHWEQEMQSKVKKRLDNVQSKHIHFVGYDPDTALYHAAADVYALTSREDPFPNVVLESLTVAVPAVAFAGTGGAAELLEQLGGSVVPAIDITAFAAAVSELLSDSDASEALGLHAQHHVDQHFSFRAYLFDLCRLLGFDLPKVSVVVPNWNYAHYLEARLDSIRRQTLPFYELIILDDASSDDSLQKIEKWLTKTGTEASVVVNGENSANVFLQWNRGLSLATGDYIWIAEADDLSSPDFLATVLPPLQTSEIVLSYCESCQIDAQGEVIATDYRAYLSPLLPRTWDHEYTVDGSDEIRTALAVMNTIPNVSAVVFRRDRLAQVFHQHLEDIAGFKKAGDWIVYIHVLRQGKITFSPEAKNFHRRHEKSVIAAASAATLYHEIAAVQRRVASAYSLESQVQCQADDYLHALRQQFGLTELNCAGAGIDEI